MVKYEVVFLPKAIKLYSKLSSGLQEEIEETIELLRDSQNHERLKVHKLHGILKNFYSARVNYEYRVIFSYDGPLLVVSLFGDHSLYK